MNNLFPCRIIILTLCALLFHAGVTFASSNECWIELQKEWRDDRGPASLFDSLKKASVDPQRIRLSTRLERPDKAEGLSLYVRAACRIEASINGRNLARTLLSETENLFEVPQEIWRPINEITLTSQPQEKSNEEPVIPAVFLVCRDGIERLRTGLVRISRDAFKHRGSVDLSGPIFMKPMTEEEYRLFKDDPASYRLDYRECYSIIAPAPADHILGGGHPHLINEFLIDVTAPISRPLCLVIDTVTGPDELYIDGVPAGSTGEPANPSMLYYDRVRMYPIQSSLLPVGKHRFTIISHQSTRILLGNIEGTAFRLGDLEEEYLNFTLREGIAVALVAIYLVVGLYYGLLFLQRRENREYLFFFLGTTSMSCYFFMRTQTKYLIFDDFYILKKIEYILLFLIMPSLALFIHFFFKARRTITEKIFRSALYAFIIINITFIMVPLISSDLNDWNGILHYAQPSWIVPVLYLLYLISRETLLFIARPFIGRAEKVEARGLTAAARKRWNKIVGLLPAKLAGAARVDTTSFRTHAASSEPDGVLMIAAVFIMIASAVHDVLIDRQVITGERLTTYGTMFFILGIAAILSNRILKLYRQIGGLNRELELSAATAERRADYLHGIIIGIEGASNRLVSVSDELSQIERTFSNLAQEQAERSDHMKEDFTSLTASISAISKAAREQAQEGEKTSATIELFNKTQTEATNTIQSILDAIVGVSTSKLNTEASLSLMMEKMRVINEGGAAIKNFVEVINDVSDRINLLSLNASIEAARAGESGRGFAVVADEIGKLAEMTSSNSKEISSQISKILNDITEGMHTSDVTKSSLESIFAVLDNINTRIDQVESLIQRQAEAFENVVRQADIIKKLSAEIVTATEDQKGATSRSAEAVDRVATIAEEVASLAGRILSLTETINEKSRELERLIKGID